MFKVITAGTVLLAGHAAAAPSPVEEVVPAAELMSTLDGEVIHAAQARGRELFPLYAVQSKCARYCSAINKQGPQMSLGAEAQGFKRPAKALEMLALNDDLNTVVQSDSMCTRRKAMARAAGLAAGLALSQVNAPGFAAETKMVKMGTDGGQLVFQPDELKVCKGDTVTWVNNKGGPHNVVFDEEAIPAGVSQEKISMDGQLGEEGEKFSMKFDTAGSYGYYCEPHRGAGMVAALTVE
jgi:plastocyanin